MAGSSASPGYGGSEAKDAGSDAPPPLALDHGGELLPGPGSRWRRAAHSEARGAALGQARRPSARRGGARRSARHGGARRSAWSHGTGHGARSGAAAVASRSTMTAAPRSTTTMAPSAAWGHIQISVRIHDDGGGSVPARRRCNLRWARRAYGWARRAYLGFSFFFLFFRNDLPQRASLRARCGKSINCSGHWRLPRWSHDLP